MLIISVGDIFGLILLAGAAIYALYAIISSVIYLRREKKPEDKPEPKKAKRATRGDKIAYVIAIVLLVIVYFIWRYAHNNGL